MKAIKNIGLAIFLIALTIFTTIIFTGSFKVTPAVFEEVVAEKKIKSELFIETVQEEVVNTQFQGIGPLSANRNNIVGVCQCPAQEEQGIQKDHLYKFQ